MEWSRLLQVFRATVASTELAVMPTRSTIKPCLLPTWQIWYAVLLAWLFVESVTQGGFGNSVWIDGRSSGRKVGVRSCIREACGTPRLPTRSQSRRKCGIRVQEGASS